MLIQYLFIALFLCPIAYAENNKGERMEKATFGGGCFWCMEHPFEEIPGVQSVISGYAGGTVENPTYEQVKSSQTGHAESIQVTYDPTKTPYQELLNVYWRNIKPTQKNGQFNDDGPQYRTVIFYHSEEQKKEAEKSKKKLEDSKIFKEPIVTEITPFTNFYPAEDYHQNFYKKNPIRYGIYRKLSKRDQFIKDTWSNTSQCSKTSSENKSDEPSLCTLPVQEKSKKNPPSQNKPDHSYKKSGTEQLKKQLTDLQFQVTQKEGTEQAFKNTYWNHHEPGIYVDIVSGEPLFSSLDKFDSGTGWPSFARPIDPEFIQTKSDNKLLVQRTEIRSKYGNSHLGHVFSDGPKPNGLRYCINSASLKFIPVDELDKQGYGKWEKLFK